MALFQARKIQTSHGARVLIGDLLLLFRTENAKYVHVKGGQVITIAAKFRARMIACELYKSCRKMGRHLIRFPFHDPIARCIAVLLVATADSVGLLQPRDDHKSVQVLASRRSSVQMIRRPFHELWRPVCQLPPGKSHICKIVEEIMQPPFPRQKTQIQLRPPRPLPHVMAYCGGIRYAKRLTMRPVRNIKVRITC